MAKKRCHLFVKIGNALKRCYLRHNNVDKILILDDSLIEKVTLTIVPNPNTAKVRFYVPGYQAVGNSISVIPGTSVRYTVTKTGYHPKGNTVTVSATDSIPVALTEITYKLNVEDYTYTVNNRHATMTQYIGTSPDIVSPVLEEDEEP